MSEVVQYFRDWTFDRSLGTILGVGPLDPDHLSGNHARLVSAQGRLVRVEEHGGEGPLIKLLGYADPDSRRLLEILDCYPDGRLRSRHTYVYDEAGRVVERRELDARGHLKGRVTSHWDPQGREIEEVVWSPEGRCLSSRQYSYDASGRLQEVRVQDGQGALVGIRRLAYDEAWRVAEKLWLDASGQLQSRFVHRYEGEVLAEISLFSASGELCGTRRVEEGLTTFGG